MDDLLDWANATAAFIHDGGNPREIIRTERALGVTI